MNKICLENFKTSLSDLVNTQKKSNFQKILKYIKNPLKILPRIFWEFKKYNLELNWNERTKNMGNASVFGNLIDVVEQKNLTNIHTKILQRCLNEQIQKESKILDFGCGYGRFSNFFVEELDCNYFGVENTEFFLKNLKNEKNKNYLNFNQLLEKKYDNYFDLLFVFAVFGGFKKKKLSNIFEMLEKKIKSKGRILVVEAISEKNIEGEWSVRTENFYKNLFKNFNISTKFYFLEDNKFRQIFLGKKL